MRGFIKVHRKIWDNPIVTKSPEHLAVWIYLLTHAAYQDTDTIWQGKRYTLHAGQLITGRVKIASQIGVDQHKVERILKIFEGEQQIEQQVNRQGRLISIVAWHRYQISEQQSEQRVSNERATSEQQMSNKMSNKVSNVDNSPSQVIPIGEEVTKSKSEQQSEQRKIVYNFKEPQKVSTNKEIKKYKEIKNNQEIYISANVDNSKRTDVDNSVKEIIRRRVKRGK